LVAHFALICGVCFHALEVCFHPYFHLHTNIYQHSWKWLVINPYQYVNAYILCIYAEVDGLYLVLKSRQHTLESLKVYDPHLGSEF